MDRATTIEHLNQAERHARQGGIHIINQRTLIEDLSRKGHDTTEARVLLQQFEELQKLHVADRDRLRAGLAGMD